MLNDYDDIPSQESFCYTILDKDKDIDANGVEMNFMVTKTNVGNKVYIEIPPVCIGSDQLAEIGWLFVALAGKDYDPSSCAELLDGYGIDVPLELENLCD